MNLSCNPGRMLHQALDDLEAVERMPGYEIDMSVWLHIRPVKFRKRCRVCLAGSVLIVREGLAEKVANHGNDGSGIFSLSCSILGRSLSPCEVRVMHAINAFRCGDFQGAMMQLGIEPPDGLLGELYNSIPHVPLYESSPYGFKSSLRHAADIMLKHIPEPVVTGAVE